MTAPIFRAVEQHTGEVADRPSKFWGALSEADAFCAELDELHELRCRVEELTAERDEMRRSRGCWKNLALARAASRDELGVLFDQVVAERDDLADRLVSLGGAHQITLGLLATARNERDSMQWEVSR